MAEIDQEYPRGRAVAAVAVQRGHEVSGRFACRYRAVMAAQAKAGDHRVIECCRSPCSREMTAVAFSRCRQVVRVLAGGDGSVVAGGTRLGDRGTVEARVEP